MYLITLGQPVHSLEPKDKFGRAVKNITYIAAYMADQIALVDSHLQRVVLTDFDGRCIGKIHCLFFPCKLFKMYFLKLHTEEW